MREQNDKTTGSGTTGTVGRSLDTDDDDDDWAECDSEALDFAKQSGVEATIAGTIFRAVFKFPVTQR